MTQSTSIDISAIDSTTHVNIHKELAEHILVVENPRKSHRQRHPPRYPNDYMCSLSSNSKETI